MCTRAFAVQMLRVLQQRVPRLRAGLLLFEVSNAPVQMLSGRMKTRGGARAFSTSSPQLFRLYCSSTQPSAAACGSLHCMLTGAQEDGAEWINTKVGTTVLPMGAILCIDRYEPRPSFWCCSEYKQMPVKRRQSKTKARKLSYKMQIVNRRPGLTGN